MKKNISEANTLIGIQAIREVMEIFSGPFLTTYFIKTSIDSLVQISIYNIFVYFILAIASIIVCCVIKRKLKIETFRLGIIINFVYVLTIIILKENILNHLPIIAILYGVSAAAYWVPLGLFLINKVKNEERLEYETKNQMVKTIFKIVVPILLGSIITVSNYYITATIILFLSVIQIMFSFWLKPLENTYEKFDIKKAWKKIKNIKRIKNTILIEYLQGLCIASSSLTIITTTLVFSALHTDFKLGIITSITSAIQMLVVYLYNKNKKIKKDKKIILISSIIPIISLTILLINKCNTTIIIYDMLSKISTGLLSVIRTVQMYNTANHNTISINEQNEFWAIRETFINLGRITSYILLLIVSISGNTQNLNILMIALTFMIGLIGIRLSKFNS